jgi:hypothetical protein
MLTRGTLQQGRNQKGVSEVVPEGRTFDQSLTNIYFPKTVGEQSTTTLSYHGEGGCVLICLKMQIDPDA